MNKCRVCGREFFKEPLVCFKNMPKSAQNLPTAELLKEDIGVDLDVWQCMGCGLVQISNEPVSYYREVIRAAGISDEMKDFRLKQFDSFIKKFSLQGKKMIEIGSGQGEYLALMNQFDIQAYGLEYSQKLVMRCLKDGLNVEKGFVQSDSCLVNAPFDAFCMLNFLEHLPDPNSALKGIYNNLTENGIGLIEVPNFDMILRKNLFSEFITDHLFYFTKETLGMTLAINGFEVIDYDEILNDYVISAIVRKRKLLDISHFYKCQINIKNEMLEYIKRFEHKKVAIWGAGHQSFAIISLTDIADKIRYIIDSAEFKQGKYSPSTHVYIGSPDLLNSDPVDAVIVIAGSYSDEVARIIEQRFDKNINVAILRDYGLEII